MNANEHVNSMTPQPAHPAATCAGTPELKPHMKNT